MNNNRRVGLIPKLNGLGGMVTFQAKFRESLNARGISSSFDITDQEIDALLIVGGSKQLSKLANIRKKNIRVVHRLDGINWLHRKTKTGIRHWWRAETGNLLLRQIRSKYADHIVYQSAFVRDWWHQKYGEADVPHSIIHNGVDLARFNPQGKQNNPKDRIRLLLVEGNISGGYEIGLNTAVRLAENIASHTDKKVELAVAGKVSLAIRQSFRPQDKFRIDWLGVIDNHALPAYYRSANMLFSADLNAACPNSVLEALACGLPVLAFDTGALPELLDEQSGRLAKYGGNPWNLDPPDINALTESAFEIIDQQKTLRQGARARAEAAFSLERMLDKYLIALEVQA